MWYRSAYSAAATVFVIPGLELIFSSRSGTDIQVLLSEGLYKPGVSEVGCRMAHSMGVYTKEDAMLD